MCKDRQTDRRRTDGRTDRQPWWNQYTVPPQLRLAKFSDQRRGGCHPRPFSRVRSFLYARLQTGRIMVWRCLSVRVSVRPTLRPSIRPSVRGLRPPVFQHFSPTCFDILSWNFAHNFVLLYYRSSSSVVNLRQVLWELCPFWILEYWKYTVFRTFLLHALTYWDEILHMTLFYCTTDQVWVSSICVKFCGSYAPFGT